jgi:hypothetical protein
MFSPRYFAPRYFDENYFAPVTVSFKSGGGSGFKRIRERGIDFKQEDEEMVIILSMFLEMTE